MRSLLVLALACVALHAETPPAAPDPAYGVLETAYNALRDRDLDLAVDSFRTATRLSPDRASIRKDLAYALLKVGENVEARDQFGVAMELDASDHHVALEYAFLCNETGKKAEARRIFGRVGSTGDAASRATAEQAFRNIDLPLLQGIERWSAALRTDPENFSAHRELARLADQRDDFELALAHYEKAWRIRPDQRELLLDIGRLSGHLEKEQLSMAALLAASRGAEPRTAERARELLPDRYPYVYEFEEALALDPGNTTLRREFAYLHLEMGDSVQAEEHFRLVVEKAPGDLLSSAQLGFLRLRRNETDAAMPLLQRVMESGNKELADRVRAALELPQTLKRDSETPRAKVADEAKDLAFRSFDAGYIKDAVKYLKVAHDQDPADFAVMLKLGKTHNILQEDQQAVQWFDLARRSPDPNVAAEADEAYKNLSPSFQRFRTTFWAMPLYSSRWKDAFGYAQVKTEVRLRNLPIRPYISVRFAGDARRTIGSVAPQYLSESSFVFGLGLRTLTWKGLSAWVEAGSDVSYLDRNDRAGRMAPDYRGGASFAKGFGSSLGGEAPGLFLQTFADGVYMSRFNNTVLGYTQNRFGFTPAEVDALGGLQTQIYWNGNLTADSKRQPWANFVETGPGIRFRWRGMPESLVFSVDFLRGAYLMSNITRNANYDDIRIGAWYAFTK